MKKLIILILLLATTAAAQERRHLSIGICNRMNIETEHDIGMYAQMNFLRTAKRWRVNVGALGFPDNTLGVHTSLTYELPLLGTHVEFGGYYGFIKGPKGLMLGVTF